MRATQDVHWWHRGKRRIVEKIIRTRIASGAPLEILEVGSGTGANLPTLARFGRVTALELDDHARGLIRPLEGVTVAKGHLPDGLDAIEGRTFDLICLFDVLEHVEHDGEALVALMPHLRPGGKLLLTVPAYQWMWSAHDEIMGHWRRYTKGRLRRLCEEQGLEVLYSGYMNALLFPLMAVARVADRLLGQGKEGSTGHGIPPFGLNALFDGVFWIESLTIPPVSLPFGGSVLMLCAPDPDRHAAPCRS